MTISLKLHNGGPEGSLWLSLKIIVQLQLNLHQSVHFLIHRNRNLEKLGNLQKKIKKKVKRKFKLKVKKENLLK